MLLLFRCSTGEDWNMVMYELVNQGPNCVDSQTYEER